VELNYIIAILIQIIFYALLWFYDEYLGLLVCLIISFISGGILLFALAAEMVEKSKVPKSYFIWMIIFCIVPVVVAIFFSFVYEGNFDWLR